MVKDLPIIVGIPAYCELDWLPRTLRALALQTDPNVQVWVIVNQPAEKYLDPAHAMSTQENLNTLAWLREHAEDFPYPLHVIDAVAPIHAPPPKRSGVGWARDTVFREAIAMHGENALCVSMDADTLFAPNYLAEIRRAFETNPRIVGATVPYYHPLPSEEAQARNLLRYEIYLRYFQLNLWRIGSPYAFCALGSAIAFRAAQFRKVRGFPHRQAGEDFYFVQQLVKTGPVLRWLPEWVYPSSRPSGRTPFGTGPAIGQAHVNILDERYPFFPPASFDRLAVTFARFEALHERNVPLPIDDYLNQRLGRSVIDKLRRNHRDKQRFVRACHEWFDGLRTLQYLRWSLAEHGGNSDAATNLDSLLCALREKPAHINFQSDPIPKLAGVRDRLFALESTRQQTHDPLASTPI